MAFIAQKQSFSGKIREIKIGDGPNAVTIGGENTLPFHGFEGEIPNQPVVAIEIWDQKPEWPDALMDEYGDALNDPVAWAKKAAESGADIISLHLISADPNGANRSVEDVANTVAAVADAVDIPLIVYGCGNIEKDAEVLKKAAEVTQNKNVLLAQAEEENYRPITAAAMGYKHSVVSATPIDVNLAKQLNILINNLGLDFTSIVMGQCSTGSLGYGLEYAYSVMERDKLAALQQNDATMQVPLLANLGADVWKTKEAKTSEEEMPAWGDAVKRGILWEAVTALAFVISGANVLIMRHPKAVELVKKSIAQLSKS